MVTVLRLTCVEVGRDECSVLQLLMTDEFLDGRQKYDIYTIFSPHPSAQFNLETGQGHFSSPDVERVSFSWLFTRGRCLKWHIAVTSWAVTSNQMHLSPSVATTNA